MSSLNHDFRFNHWSHQLVAVAEYSDHTLKLLQPLGVRLRGLGDKWGEMVSRGEEKNDVHSLH